MNLDEVPVTLNAVVVGPEDRLLITVPDTYVLPHGQSVEEFMAQLVDAVIRVFGGRVLIVRGDLNIAVIKP